MSFHLKGTHEVVTKGGGLTIKGTQDLGSLVQWEASLVPTELQFIVGSTPFVTPQGTLQVGPTHRNIMPSPRHFLSPP